MLEFEFNMDPNPVEESSSYKRVVLYQTDEFELVSCEWNHFAKAPIHSHGASACFTLVQKGQFQNVLEFGNKSEQSFFAEGEVFSIPVGARHEIKCVSNFGKTLHLYSPRLREQAPEKQFRTPDLEEISRFMDIKLIQQGIPFEQLLKLASKLMLKSVSTDSPYFMNQLFAGSHAQMFLAEEIIAKTKTTMATYEASPVLSQIEDEVVQALCDQVGWPSKSGQGISVPGGSSANFMAIHCARQLRFPEYKKKGITDASKLKIFASQDAHYSLKKACVVLGLGLDALVSIDVNESGQMSSRDLKNKIEFAKSQGETPFFVCATAGTTVFGAFDSISEIYPICEEHAVWLHVDAAWGGPTLFSKQHRSTFLRSSQLADSYTFDAHKFFGAGMTCSFFLTRHKGILQEANDISGGEYLFHDSDHFDRGRLSWQCGKRADSISFWTLWKSLGTEGLGEQIDRALRLKIELVEWIRLQPRLKLMIEPNYLNVCVAVLPPRDGLDPLNWSQKVREELKFKNLAMVNYSVSSKNETFLRLIIVHPDISLSILKNILTWALEIE